MGYYVGTRIRDWINPINTSGAAVSGIATTLNTNLVTENPDNASFSATIAEEGTTGRYYIEFTPTYAGNWYWQTHYNGPPYQQFYETYAVDDYTAIAGADGAANSRRRLRQDVARELNDLLIVTATSTGTTTQFNDPINANVPNYSLTGREIYFISGTANNIGKSRIINGSTQATGAITWFPALPSGTASGDVAEIHNFRGQGWSVDEKHAAIQRALDDASHSFWRTYREQLTSAFDQASPLLTIPTDYYAINRVEYQEDTDEWVQVPPADDSGSPGWWVERGLYEIRIGGMWKYRMDNQPVRITGYKAFQILSSDNAVTDCNPEWVIQQACAYLLRYGRERSGDGTRERWAMQYQQRADRIRDLVAAPALQDTVMVR